MSGHWMATAAALAAVLTASAAHAATRSAPASVTIENTPLGLGNSRGLNFGSVVPTGSDLFIPVYPPGYNPGPSRGNASLPSGSTNTALFTLTGTPTREVTVTLPPNVHLTSGGADSLLVDNIAVGDTAGSFTPVDGSNSSAWTATIPTSGALPFELGGGLHVDGYPRPGSYTGTVTINVDYN